MRIRAAEQADAGAVARVHIDAWRTTYAGIVPDEYLGQLSYEQRADWWGQILRPRGKKPPWAYVAEDDEGQVVGFVSGALERSGDPLYKGELYAIYLLEQAQRKGIGKQLTLTLVARMIEEGVFSMLVWVLAENPSRPFYEAMGGQQLREEEVTIGGAKLIEVAYGWPDIRAIIKSR
ncbi:MAG: GNAT family N-acetyltransferase [Ardenticatenaceae bacterium]